MTTMPGSSLAWVYSRICHHSARLRSGERFSSKRSLWEDWLENRFLKLTCNGKYHHSRESQLARWCLPGCQASLHLRFNKTQCLQAVTVIKKGLPLGGSLTSSCYCLARAFKTRGCTFTVPRYIRSGQGVKAAVILMTYVHCLNFLIKFLKVGIS